MFRAVPPPIIRST